MRLVQLPSSNPLNHSRCPLSHSVGPLVTRLWLKRDGRVQDTQGVVDWPYPSRSYTDTVNSTTSVLTYFGFDSPSLMQLEELQDRQRYTYKCTKHYSQLQETYVGTRKRLECVREQINQSVWYTCWRGHRVQKLSKVRRKDRGDNREGRHWWMGSVCSDQ